MGAAVGLAISPAFSVRASSSAPAWVPTDISGCEFWVRADLGITLNGSAVSSWSDQSGNGRDASNVVGAQQPAWVESVAAMNNRAAVSFDGGDILTTAAFALPRAVTAFFVLGSLTTRGMVLEHGAANDGFYIYAVGAASAAVFGAAGVGYHRARESPPALFAAANSRNAVIYDESSAPVLRAAGATVPPTLVEGAAQSAESRTKALNLGARSGPAIGHAGQVFEIILWSRALTGSELDTVDGYLSARYGV